MSSDSIIIPISICPECGETSFVEETKEQSFPYQDGDALVTLKAEMPVTRCLECGSKFFDERGEVARQASICAYHRVQSPQGARQIREATQLSRERWSMLSGFGIASIQRWESGSCVQNQSSARLLHLMQFEENLARLQEFHEQGPSYRAVDMVLDNAAHSIETVARRRCRRHPRVEGRTGVIAASQQFCLRPHR